MYVSYIILSSSQQYYTQHTWLTQVNCLYNYSSSCASCPVSEVANCSSSQVVYIECGEFALTGNEICCTYEHLLFTEYNIDSPDYGSSLYTCDPDAGSGKLVLCDYLCELRYDYIYSLNYPHV